MIHYTKIFLLCLILAFFGLISGCSSPRYISSSSNIKIVSKDSLFINTKLISVALPLESHSIITKSKSHLETSLAESDAEIDSLGLLHHTLVNKKDSIRTKIQYIDKIVYRDSIETKEVPVEVEKPVPYIPKFYQFTFAFFGIFVLFIVVRLLRKLGFLRL